MNTCWLTEDPLAIAEVAGVHTDWRELRPGGDPVLDRLATAFNPGRPTWLRTDGDPASGPVRYMVIIQEADRSQFDAMLACAAEGGLPDRIVCLALTGSNFRGQRSRPWSALPGNLHLTAYYRLSGVPSERRADLTMLPAVAAAFAIQACSGGSCVPRIKWVNDVFVQGRKVSGVLTSTRLSAGGGIEHVLFGIGMNIRQAPGIQPSPFVPAAGCLGDFDPSLTDHLAKVFRQIVDTLDDAVDRLQGPDTGWLFRTYRAFAGFIGERVCLWPEGTEDWQAVAPVYRGRVVDLNPDLSLVLDQVASPVLSGRMAYESVWTGFAPVPKS